MGRIPPPRSSRGAGPVGIPSGRSILRARQGSGHGLVSPVDNYCERLDASYWSEPLNAITNASFILAALICWRIIGDRRDLGARLLTLVLAAIGVGSFLFHTHAQTWAALADVIPIQLFILIYVYFSTVRFFDLPRWTGLVAVALFIPYAALTSRGIEALAGPLNGSVGYAPVPILIAAYAVALRTRAPATARGLAIGAGILVVSLVFRTLDAAVCPALPDRHAFPLAHC